MVKLTDLETFLNDYLDVKLFKDYAPNGIQVQGREEIKRIVCGVTASQALLDYALDSGADSVLVHHGYFWKGESSQITGIKYRRLKSLLSNDISLLAYHLPLDSHPIIGNNAQLAKLLDISLHHGLDSGSGPSIAMAGQLSQAMSLSDFGQVVQEKLTRKPMLVSGGDHPILNVGICTGGGQDYIELAASQGMDAFISGEISERTTHLARELGIHYICAGHHATERYGVKALGELLKQTYDIDVEFLDIDNPA